MTTIDPDQALTPIEALRATGYTEEGIAKALGWKDKGALRVDLMARHIAQTVPVATSPDGRLWVHVDGVWRADNSDVGRVVSRALGDGTRVAHVREVEAYLGMMPEALPVLEPLPTPAFVNMLNGLLRWDVGLLTDHDPRAGSTVQIPVWWDPEAKCPDFETFLAEVLPADLVEPTDDSPGWIWEVLGYCLYSGNPFHKALLLHGAGRNGKGTLLRVITAMLGRNNVSSVPLHELSTNRFRAATLYGKIANIAGDLEGSYLESTGLFKNITGGDSIQGEHKYGAVFDFTPYALPIYSTNSVFSTPDNSEGYISRWLVIPFPHSFIGREDATLGERLEAEVPGVTVKAVEGLQALMRRGRFAKTASTDAAAEEFARASDPIRRSPRSGWRSWRARPSGPRCSTWSTSRGATTTASSPRALGDSMREWPRHSQGQTSA